MKKFCLITLLIVLSFCLMASERLVTGNIDSQVLRDPNSPYNLMAQIINDNDVLLFWENPTYLNPPMGFRVFCNEMFVLQLNDSDANTCIIENVCPGCHQFYVTAFFDTGSQTAPSNSAEVNLTANQDFSTPVALISISAYPNPSRSVINITLSSPKHNEDAHLSIYNQKGQLVRQGKIEAGKTWQWNGKDTSGRNVSDGIYYLKAKTSNGDLMHKLRIAK